MLDAQLAVEAPGSPAPFPFEHNPIFTGREELLDRLYLHFQTPQDQYLPAPSMAGQTMPGIEYVYEPLAIRGPAGIGKTQLAIEYAVRCSQPNQLNQAYQVVLWAQADAAEALMTAYLGFAEHLHVSPQPLQDPAKTIEAVIDWLSHSPGWLLILDDVSDLGLILKFLPTRCSGHVLLTTRTLVTDLFARQIEIGPLDAEDGRLLLLRSAGLQNAPSSEYSLASQLVRELSNWPLALVQAGAYIRQAPCDLTRYLGLYQKKADRLRRHKKQTNDPAEPITITWELSFDKIKEVKPRAARLLQLCAFVAPYAIPERLLERTWLVSRSVPIARAKRAAHQSWLVRLLSGLRRKKPAFADKDCEPSFALLQDYALVMRDKPHKTLTIQRSVQAALSESMPLRMRQQLTNYLIHSFHATYPESLYFNMWTSLKHLLPHLFTCATGALSIKIVSLEAAYLLNHAGHYLHEQGRYAEVKCFYLTALQILERLWQKAPHPDIAANINNLAGLYQELGQDAEVEPLYQRSWEMREKLLGLEHPRAIIGLSNLALLYKSQGRYPEAERLYRRVLQIREAQLDELHPDLITSRENLAELMKLQQHP